VIVVRIILREWKSFLPPGILVWRLMPGTPHSFSSFSPRQSELSQSPALSVLPPWAAEYLEASFERQPQTGLPYHAPGTYYIF
jgi:hypothetical protein